MLGSRLWRVPMWSPEGFTATVTAAVWTRAGSHHGSAYSMDEQSRKEELWVSGWELCKHSAPQQQQQQPSAQRGQ